MQVMSSARVHLFYGLPGSGKSTLARALATGGPAVRFTLDEWMLRLHPEVSFDDDAYGELLEPVRELIWSIAEQVLASGVDVLLDWNSWSTQRRRWAIERAQAAGAEVVVHVLSTSVEDAAARAGMRSAAGSAFAHPVSRADIEHLASLLEEPTVDEGVEIVEH